MVARSDSMFGCYDSYSYRLWSLANVWNTCQLPPLTNGIVEDEELAPSTDYFIKCSQCHRGCQSFLALKEHMETSHGESVTSPENGTITKPTTLSPTPTLVGSGGPFACSQCSSSFGTKEQLEKHELLHSPNAQVSCKICNKTFANVYRLQRHMISHDESAVLRKFKCTECDKAFKFKHHLKEHIRIHSGEKPFECGNCGKRFSHSGSYSSHMTSKKCLVMNLKLGRTRATTNSVTDKNARLLKRTNDSPMNNNISSSPDHNSYLPMLPKYSEAAAVFLQSSLAANSQMAPFYLTSPALLNTPHPHSYNLPTLSQILDQIQQRVSPMRPSFLNNHESQNSNIPKENEIDVETPQDDQDENSAKSNAGSSVDLIMDEDIDIRDDEEKKKPDQDINETGDLEAVKRILETVNASVTKQFLQANMQKFSSESSNNSDCRSMSPLLSPKRELFFACNNCNKQFETAGQLHEHECELQSEGLAAKLEDAITCKTEDFKIERRDSFSGNEDMDYDKAKGIDEVYCESVTTTDQVSEDGRKVRVRSLISDEQLKVLKDNYSLNPRPKREDLEKISSSIGFPVRVVQVWFQNTRARDRREGRLIHVPYSTSVSSTLKYSPSILPPTPHSLKSKVIDNYLNNIGADEPLDLSTKKSYNSPESTPPSSPARPTSENLQSEFCDEIVNLSRKLSRRSVQYPDYSKNYHNSNSSEIPTASSPTDLQNSSRLAQILGQSSHKFNLTGMGLVPMEQLMQFGVADLSGFSQLINNNQISNGLSPNSDKRWNDFKDVKMDLGDEDASNLSKRLKMSQYMLKSLGSPLLGNPEVEPEGQFICDQCDKAFSKQSSLARHKYEHSGQRPHKCDECPKAFKHKHHLTEHKRLHSGEKPFQCTKCLKRFSHSGSYSQHMNHRYSYCKPYRE